MRYSSRRNPYTRQAFYQVSTFCILFLFSITCSQMRISLQQISYSPSCPAIVGNLINRAIMVISNLAPPTYWFPCYICLAGCFYDWYDILVILFNSSYFILSKISCFPSHSTFDNNTPNFKLLCTFRFCILLKYLSPANTKLIIIWFWYKQIFIESEFS